MSQQIINISTPDDGLGDVLRNGFDKTNQNFTELYNGKVDKITGKGLSKNDFTDTDKAKLDGIEAGAEVNVQADWGETDPLAKSFILNKPPSLYSAFGYFHISDLATQTTPLAFLAATPLQLTNDGRGAFSNYEQAPYGVSDIWNTSTNQFEFAKLSVGDTVLVRADLLISTTSVNQNLRLYIKFGVGTPSEYDLLIDSWNEKSVVTFEKFVKDVSFSIDNKDWRDVPAKIYILSDDDGSVKVNGWYTPIIRKSVNVIDFNSDPLKLDKVSTAGVERVYTINADGSQGTKATSDFKDVIFGYFNGTNFYTDSGFTNLITPESGKIYVNIAVTPSNQYRWSGSAYVQLSAGIDFPVDGKTYGAKNGVAVRVEEHDLFNPYTSDYFIGTIRANGAGVTTFTLSGILNPWITTGTLEAYTEISEYTLVGLKSAATAGSFCQVKNSGAARVIFNASQNLNKLITWFIFRNSDAAPVTNARFFVGVCGQGTILGNTNPSTQINLIGVGSDSGDANIQIIHNDSGGLATKVDLGSNFPANTQNVDTYLEQIFFDKPNNKAYIRLVRLNTGNSVIIEISSNIPNATSFNLEPYIWRNNGGDALEVKMRISSFLIAQKMI